MEDIDTLLVIDEQVPKSCKHRTSKTRKGILLSELNAESISLRSHPFHEQK